MSDVRLIFHADELDALAQDWQRLLTETDFYYPSLGEVKHLLQARPGEACVAAVEDGTALVGAACFMTERAPQAFSVGERRLFNAPVRRTSKIGFAGLGSIEAGQWSAMVEAVMSKWPFTVFDLGEVPLGSPLQGAVGRLGGRVLAARGRKSSFRWSIDLPSTFEQYLDSLRPSTRKSVTYKIRRFERDQKYELLILTRTDEVERFLKDGEAVSRRTYQWTVGQRLENDAPTREHFKQLAEEGRMRCYLLYIDGKPAAFMRNDLQAGICHYETPGFDPQFEKASPGIVMLMWAIKDLIENTDCRIFDFGEGGDLQGYKARFGNRSIECQYVALYPVSNPYSLALYSASMALSFAKNAADHLVGKGEFRQRIKKAIRKYEVDGPQG